MNQNKFRFGKIHTILIILALVVIGMGFTTLLSNEVTLNLDGKEEVLNTTSKTVEEFLGERNIKLEEHSYLDPAADTEISSQMKITVRSPKEVIILDDGIEKTVKTGNLTTESILMEHGYELKDQDYTVPGLEEEIDFTIKGAPVIIINRVYNKTITEVVSIPFESETRENPEILKGESKVVTEGVNGSKIVTTAKTIENGEEITSVVSEEIVTEPIKKVTEVGTKEPPKPPVVQANQTQTSNSQASSGNTGGGYINGRKILRTITMNATAYDASYESNGKWAGVTALGTKLRPGVVAVDRNVIPLGTSLYIESNDSWPSYGMAVAEDVGGAIKGNKIDLFFPSSSTVRSFGRRTVTVHVLAP